MSKVIFLFLLMCVSGALQSQEERHHELGMNITNVIKKVFGLNDSSTPGDPYLVSWKFGNGNSMWRLGADFDIDLTNENTDNGGGPQDLKNKLFVTQLKFGKEWRKPVAKKFSMLYGWEGLGLYKYDHSQFTQFQDLGRTTSSYGMGMGSFLGLLFHCSEQLNLGMEGNLRLMYIHSSTDQDIDISFPPLHSSGNNIKMDVTPPGSLYLHWRF